MNAQSGKQAGLTLVIRPRLTPPAGVVITSKLHERGARARNYELEANSLRALTSDLLVSPRELLDRLTTLACELTNAPSAGISLITARADGTQEFTWISMGGEYAGYIGGHTP